MFNSVGVVAVLVAVGHTTTKAWVMPHDDDNNNSTMAAAVTIVKRDNDSHMMTWVFIGVRLVKERVSIEKN
jgi:hypothetical protein